MTSRIRDTIIEMLHGRGQAPAGDDDPLFTSGRLDSLAAVEIMVLLEKEFGIDLADADFDISRLDTIADLERLTAGT